MRDESQYRQVLLGGFRLRMHMFTGSTQPLRTSQDPTDKNTKTKTVTYLYIHLEELLSC